MTQFVADASIVAAWFLDDEASEIAEEVATRVVAGEEIWAPILLRYEVVNVLTVAFTKRKRITQESLKEKLEAFDRIPIAYDPESSYLLTTATPAFSIGPGLSIYDASYLELAARKELPLATLDESMKQAAKRVGVELL